MTTLSSLQKQIEALQRKADAIRKAEMADAIKKVKQLIAQYGLTAQDVGLDGAAGRGKPKGRASSAGAAKTEGVAKYRDPQSGKTWTGRGKPPNWIAGVADRSKFLIDGAGGALATSDAVRAMPVKTAQAGAKAFKPAAKKATRTKSDGEQLASAGKKSVRAAKNAAAVPKGSKRSARKTETAKVQEHPAEASATPQAA